jgi:hypothetical protein
MPIIPALGEAETGGSQIQGQPGLYRDFQTSLNNIVRPCLKPKNQWFIPIILAFQEVENGRTKV